MSPNTVRVNGYAVLITTHSTGRNAICEWCGWTSPHLSIKEADAVRRCPSCGLTRGQTGFQEVRSGTT
ncbi:hypothetical protein [Calidifontibacter indicus]|uniref:Uncharacterized protein n=1 Tax=Calidifontibacter indicus TaxID=419650 RepID=A0A3D9U561_9MICO|nr:hypothetical protein [Calidifontibacter indicus]REF24632.1 hypothetical protein DFJ65_3418 [Calidifontibacter indicus]